MPYASESAESPSSAAPTIPISHNGDGSRPKTSRRPTGWWKVPRQCAWCGKEFTLRYVQEAQRRFCGTSCSAKWRMSQPEILAKVHAPAVARKRGDKRHAWFAAGSPAAEAERERIRALNPTKRPEVRAKISRTLEAMHHGPFARGGNGQGLTAPQRILLGTLGAGWVAEFALSLGQRTPGYPTHYKLDIAHPVRGIAIEVDGNSHYTRRALDAKKDAKLATLGWTVLRFWNRDILTWNATGMPMDSSISMTLAQHGILPSR